MMDNRFEAAFSTFLDRHEKIAEINKKIDFCLIFSSVHNTIGTKENRKDRKM